MAVSLVCTKNFIGVGVAAILFEADNTNTVKQDPQVLKHSEH